MATMTRSKSQVIRGFLPGQTFQHPNDTVVRVSNLYAGPADVNTELLVELLDEKLSHWQRPGDGGGPPVNRAIGFLKPVRNHADQYAFLEPEGEVFYYTWPLVLRCTNPTCQKAAVFDSLEDWTGYKRGNPAKCDKCGSRREQYDFMLVHSCGNDAAIPVWPCKVKDASGQEHGLKDVYLNDTGSFITSTWRCRYGSCNDRVISRMRQPPCRCGEGPYQYVLVRQERRFITQTFSFVSFARRSMVELRSAAGAEKVVVGSYLEFFADYEKALADAGKDRSDVEEKWKTIKAALEATGTPPEQVAEMRKTVVGESGVFDDIVALVGDEDIVTQAGSEQRAAERTLIWGGAGGLRTWRLDDFQKAARNGGRHGAVAVLHQGKRRLAELGFSDLLVVENFPVALVAYGFTRLGSDPQHVMLRAFSTPKKGKYRDKTPIYINPTKTEAVFFELDAATVLTWLADNGRITMPNLPAGGTSEADKERRQAAKAHMLRLYRIDGDVRTLTNKLQHTIAHALIRNLGERSGFSQETMAEYLIPELLTIGLYADTHQEFTLGALVSLVEHRLAEWLDATVDGAESCAWDPTCGQQDGACAACLHLAFGCSAFNGELDRAVLFGTPPGHEQVLDLARGYWQ